MKRLIRSREPREFRSAAGGAARSVADMFDSAIAWFTPERRARILFPVEIALGTWLALAILLNQQWWGGIAQGLINGGVAVLLGLAVALHRVRPAIALTALVAGGLGTVAGFLVGGYPDNGFVFLAAAIVLFGASAYGTSSARWTALGLSLFVAAIMLVTVIISAGTYYGVGLGYVVQHGIALLFWTVVPMLPWVLGELVRSIRNRRQLSATVATVSTQRDAALTRADLEAAGAEVVEVDFPVVTNYESRGRADDRSLTARGLVPEASPTPSCGSSRCGAGRSSCRPTATRTCSTSPTSSPACRSRSMVVRLASSEKNFTTDWAI